MLSPSLLEELRSCWRRDAPKCYLLEGKRAGQPIDATSTLRWSRAGGQLLRLLRTTHNRNLGPPP